MAYIMGGRIVYDAEHRTMRVTVDIDGKHVLAAVDVEALMDISRTLSTEPDDLREVVERYDERIAEAVEHKYRAGVTSADGIVEVHMTDFA